MTSDLPLPPESRAITPDTMSDTLTAELVQDLDLGDWELSDWEAQFISSNLSNDRFSIKQKSVIYKLARRYNLL